MVFLPNLGVILKKIILGICGLWYFFKYVSHLSDLERKSSLILLCHINGLRKNSYIALSSACFCAFEMNERSACLEFPPKRLRDDDIYSVIPEVVFGDPKSSPGYRQNGLSNNGLPDFGQGHTTKKLDSRPKDRGNDDTTFRHPLSSFRGSIKLSRIQTEWICKHRPAGLREGHTTKKLAQHKHEKIRVNTCPSTVDLFGFPEKAHEPKPINCQLTTIYQHVVHHW